MTKQATLLPPLTTAEVLDLIRERIAYHESRTGDRSVVRDVKTKRDVWQEVHASTAGELRWVLNVVEQRGIE